MERLYLYVNLGFHFHHSSYFMKCKCLVGAEPRKSDGSSDRMLKRRMGEWRWGDEGEMRKCQNLLFRSLTKSSLASVLQRAGDWRPKQQD